MKLKFRFFKDGSKESRFLGKKVNRKSNYIPMPRITVADLYDDDGNLKATGYALCSHSENPEKKTGKRIAAGRAWKAYSNESSCGPILRNEAQAVIVDCLDSLCNDKESKHLFHKISTPLKCIYHG